MLSLKKPHFATIALITSIVGIYLASTKMFKIRDIRCSTQFGSCPPAVESLLLSQFNQAQLLFGFPGQKIRSKLKSFPAIDSVIFYKHLPSSLAVSLKLRTPVGVVVTSASPSFKQLASSDGILLGPTADSFLPILILTSAPILPAQLDHTATMALHTLSLLTSLIPVQLTGELINTSDLVITSPNSPQIFLNVTHSDSQWYSSLHLILKRSKISLKSPQIIDLRFTNPVLTY